MRVFHHRWLMMQWWLGRSNRPFGRSMNIVPKRLTPTLGPPTAENECPPGENATMTEPSLSALASVLRPFTTIVFQHVRRLSAERQAGQEPLIRTSTVMDGLLNNTLDRIRNGRIDSSWWQSLLHRVGHQYIAPDFLKKPVLRGWLAEESVAKDLKMIATWRIMDSAQDEAVPRDRLAQSYSHRTGEVPYLAARPIDVVVAVLVAGYFGASRSDDRAITGIMQTGFLQISERLDQLGQALPLTTDPVTCKAHTQDAEKRLAQILSLRGINPARARHDTQELLKRLDSGDLSAAAAKIKHDVRYWTARLSASDVKTLEIAKELRVQINNDDPDRDLSIIDALICETQDNPDEAVRLLRDRDDPDSRAVFFGLLARSRDAGAALAEFAERMVTAHAEFFTSIGWRNWAHCMIKVGRWMEAAEVLVRIGDKKSDSPMLALIEGIINAQLLLPTELRNATGDLPISAGIRPMQGEDAENIHARAAACLEMAQAGFGELEASALERYVAFWRQWLRLMDPKDENARVAREQVRQDLDRDEPDIRAVPLAWAFEISFNREPIRRYLSGREKLGGLDDDELRAQCLLLLIDMDSGALSGRNFLRYLNAHRKRLDRVMSNGLLKSANIRALVVDNQTARARKRLEEMRGDLDDEGVRRLSAMIDSHAGLDPRQKLERAYQETGSITDLRNLVECVRNADDNEALLPLLRELVGRHRTVANVTDLAVCLSGRPFSDHRQIVELLDSNEAYADLVEQSVDLKVVKAWALFHSGQLSKAKVHSDEILNNRSSVNMNLSEASVIGLDINIALASGDWERLPAIVEREWPRRDEHTANTLLGLAQISPRQGKNPDRALMLARLAAEKAPDDPHVLAASYWLHFQHGRDGDADRDWLSRALELSSDEDGPVWSVDLQTVATNWMPTRRERLAEIRKQWLAGEIPTGLAASLWDVSLTRLLVQIPETNADEPDRRLTEVVPVGLGKRAAVELQTDWAIGLDITSILVLHYLGFLEFVFCVFKRVKLASDVMLSLFREQDRVRFHQPSRIRDGQQVQNLCNLQRLRVADGIEAPPTDAVDELGRELAELLHAARQGGGKVVCVFPIHQPKSMMEKEADTTAWNDLLVSVFDLCRLLHMRGDIDADTHERVQLFLRTQGQAARGDAETSILDGAIYLDDLALSYLQSAKVLDQVATSNLDLRIHSRVLDRMEALVRAGQSGEDLAVKIDEIRHVLRSAVESGRASYLPRSVDQEESVPNRDDPFAATRSLLAAAAECDALCVDDRFINSSESITVTEKAERTIPIVCVLDVLDCLVEQAHLRPVHLWTARHKLRSGGFVFIPLEVDELVHWLKTAPVENGLWIESAELRAIRQSMAQTSSVGLFNPDETFVLSDEVTQTSVCALRSLWRNQCLAVETVVTMSTWVWRHLIANAPGGHGDDEEKRRKTWTRESVLRRVSAVLLPPGIESSDRRDSFARWVDESVLQPFRPANVNLIDDALTLIADSIPDEDCEDSVFVNFFLSHLPDSCRQYLLKKYPDRARRWGFETRTVFGLEAGIKILDKELFAAARHVLSGKGERSIRSIMGDDILVDLDPGDLTVVLVNPDTGPGNREKIPDLSVFSPDSQTRVAALGSMLDRLGPTAPDFGRLLADLELGEPDDSELTDVFREAADGVAALQGSLLRKICPGQPLDVVDVVPEDLAYYEKFVGPQPESRDPDQYISRTLIPYRRALLDRDLSRGLDICCVGALREDLCPGQWTFHIDDNEMWDALNACDADKTPVSLLGALDVALYRQHDDRFRDYAARAIIKLCSDGFDPQQSTEFYKLFWIFTFLTFNRVSLIENGSKQPGFWRRMCAWMQAQFIVRALSRESVSVDLDKLEGWAMSNMALVGAYAELVSAREEPMLLFAERLPPSDLRCEVLGRLVGLRSRHASEGRSIPQSETIDQALERAQESGNWLKCFFPGPLEGHRRPTEPASEQLVGTLKESVPDGSLPASWHFMANLSHLHALGECELGVAREAVVRVGDGSDEGEMRNTLLSLEAASMVAKTSRDTLLADAIADAVASIARRVSNENDIWLILVICLQAAAAFEEHDAWFDWLEERLARIASSLPGPPNRSVPMFLEHLDAMETILPIGSWFHRRARSIASMGTVRRP